MNGKESPLSPAAMRAMAMQLLERAAEIEFKEKSSGMEAANVLQLDLTAATEHSHAALRERYPIQALASLAESIYRQRQKREVTFGLDVSNEPAWDILLDLFVQRAAGKRVSTSSACIASNAPPTTALRYITLLEKKGLVRRTFDPADKRVAYVELMPQAYRKMTEHLNDVHEEFVDAAQRVRASFMVVN